MSPQKSMTGGVNAKRYVTLIAFSILFSFLPATFAQSPTGEKKVPDFVASTLDGKSFALMNYLQQAENKVLVLAFFATWCELCDEDFKFFQRLQDRYEDQGLRVLCVFTGSRSRIIAAKEYLESLQIELPVLLDAKRMVTKLFKVAGFPCAYAIDNEGFLRIKCLGCSEEAKMNLERNLKTLLAAP